MADQYPQPAIYDILHTPGTAAEITALLRVVRRHAPRALEPGALWLEPACGTGRYLRGLLRRGLNAAGFDRDVGMLAYAAGRRDMKEAVLFPADMADFAAGAAAAGLAPGSVAAVFNLVNSLRHLATDTALLRHLEQVAGLLASGGVYVVGISLTDYRWLEPEEDQWEGVRGRCRVSQLVNYLPPEPGTPRARTETVISHLTITRPRGVEHFDHSYGLRTFDERQWDRVISASPLRRAGSYDAAGHPLDGRRLPYQLEALAHP